MKWRCSRNVSDIIRVFLLAEGILNEWSSDTETTWLDQELAVDTRKLINDLKNLYIVTDSNICDKHDFNNY